jgi:hypothetical protein
MAVKPISAPAVRAILTATATVASVRIREAGIDGETFPVGCDDVVDSYRLHLFEELLVDCECNAIPVENLITVF